MTKNSQKPTSCSHHYFHLTLCTRNPSKTTILGKALVLFSGNYPGEMDLISFAQSSTHIGGWWSPFLGPVRKCSPMIKYSKEKHNHFIHLSADKALIEELPPWVKQWHKKNDQKTLSSGNATSWDTFLDTGECLRDIWEQAQRIIKWCCLQFRITWSSMNWAGWLIWNTFCWNPGAQSKSSADVSSSTWEKPKPSIF